MLHHRPRVGIKAAPSRALTIAILTAMLALGAWALHGGAVTFNAANVFGP